MRSLQKIITGVKEVKSIHHLRARLLGDKLWVDIGVRVAPANTVNNCESIRNRVKRNIQKEIQGVGEVFVDFHAVEET